MHAQPFLNVVFLLVNLKIPFQPTSHTCYKRTVLSLLFWCLVMCAWYHFMYNVACYNDRLVDMLLSVCTESVIKIQWNAHHTKITTPLLKSPYIFLSNYDFNINWYANQRIYFLVWGLVRNNNKSAFMFRKKVVLYWNLRNVQIWPFRYLLHRSHPYWRFGTHIRRKLFHLKRYSLPPPQVHPAYNLRTKQ